MYSRINRALTFLSLSLLWACQAPQEKKQAPPAPKVRVIPIKKGVQVGMSSADVTKVFGTPNMVSTDAFGEVWIYNKMPAPSKKAVTTIVKFDDLHQVRDLTSY